MELSCHCKNINIIAGEPKELTQCNCSICSRYMCLWGYYLPEEPNINIGSFGLDSYSWGDEELDFFRCSNCGCVTHYATKPGQPNPKIALNFRLSSQSVKGIPARYFNGAEEL